MAKAEKPKPVCGAKTRSGAPCKTPPVHGSKRCRMHGGKGSGAPEGNQNARTHGLNARYVTVDELDDVLPDPVERMRVLSSLMANRALAAHQATVEDAERDTDATDVRIARAVRTAAAATRVELAAAAAQKRGDVRDPLTAVLGEVDGSSRGLPSGEKPSE